MPRCSSLSSLGTAFRHLTTSQRVAAILAGLPNAWIGRAAPPLALLMGPLGQPRAALCRSAPAWRTGPSPKVGGHEDVWAGQPAPLGRVAQTECHPSRARGRARLAGGAGTASQLAGDGRRGLFGWWAG